MAFPMLKLSHIALEGAFRQNPGDAAARIAGLGAGQHDDLGRQAEVSEEGLDPPRSDGTTSHECRVSMVGCLRKKRNHGWPKAECRKAPSCIAPPGPNCW